MLEAAFLARHGIPAQRRGNNAWADKSRVSTRQSPLSLLNSHHDTVKPGVGLVLPLRRGGGG
ncbi:MAG: hypothetical protein WKG07_38300 [Hymenobacter sp.]